MVILNIIEANLSTRILNIDSFSLMQIISVSFLAILFLQSGLDKVFDWKGNLEWMKAHFSESILKEVVPLLLATVTLVEVSAGIFSTVGVVNILVGKGDYVAFVGTLLSSMALLMLFFGQRIAKDYAGAGGLVPYFILTLVTLYILLH